MRSRSRHGGILFELLLSIALFVGAGTFVLGSVKSVFQRLDRTARSQLALDLARSTLSQLELGLVTVNDIHNETIIGIGSVEEFEPPYVGGAFDPPEWVIEVDTERSAYRGLTLVTITVREERFDDAPSLDPLAEPDDAIVATIRQLVRLHGEDAESFEEDDLLDGLPMDEVTP